MDRLEHNNIVKEVQDSFLDYSMSVITARACLLYTSDAADD